MRVLVCVAALLAVVACTPSANTYKFKAELPVDGKIVFGD